MSDLGYIPVKSDRLVKIREVMARTSLGSSTIYRRVAAGTFGDRSGKRVAGAKPSGAASSTWQLTTGRGERLCAIEVTITL